MKGRKRAQWTVKGIIKDKNNWTKYQEKYEGKITEHQKREVEKMMGCGEFANGYAVYVCWSCGEEKEVPFSCKSRVCSSCGKVHADEWAEQLAGRLFNVVHRHMTFTVASELWEKLEANPRWRKELFGAANETLKRAIKGKAGIVMAMHPYGKDLKVNYHLHVLVTEGGMNEEGEWERQRYINYKTLRKVWQYEVLTRLRKVMAKTDETKRLIDRLFKKYREGFYDHAEPKVKDGKGVGRYIGRYLRHPASANARIKSYDGKQVTISYNERKKGRRVSVRKTMPVLVFLHGIVRHIPPKQFKMVRYYGLYASRKKEKVKQLLAKIGSMLGRKVRRLGWRARQRQEFKQDPLICPKCGASDMELFYIKVPWCGRLMTIGGWEWLFARKCITFTPIKEADLCLPSEPVAKQMAFAF